MNRKTINFMILSMIFIILSACSASSVRLHSVWRDSNYSSGYIKKVLVVGVSDNERNRKLFETEFSNRFESQLVKAVSSAELIPLDSDLTKENIKKKAIEVEADSVFVTHLVSVEEKEVYNPPEYRSDFTPIQFGPYYTSVHDYVVMPGYYSQHKYVKLESNLYDTQSEKLIWTAQSEIIDPQSVEKEIKSLCDAVMKNLKKNELIP